MRKKLVLLFLCLISIKIKASSIEQINTNQEYFIENNKIKILVEVSGNLEKNNIIYNAIINEEFDIDRDLLNEHAEVIENIDKTITLVWTLEKLEKNTIHEISYYLIPKNNKYNEKNILDLSFIEYDNIKKELTINKNESDIKKMIPPQTGSTGNIFLDYIGLILLSFLISILFIPLKDK